MIGVINSLVSPKFPHVPLGVGGWPLGYMQIVSMISNLYDHNPPTSQTDGQTIRRTTCSRKTMLCTIEHHEEKLFTVK